MFTTLMSKRVCNDIGSIRTNSFDQWTISANNMTSSSNMNKRAESPYRIVVELDERIYSPGQLLTGTVHLNLDKKLYCDQITVQLYGYARVKPGVLRQRNAFEQRKVFIDEKVDVWQSDPKKRVKHETTLDQFARNMASNRIQQDRIAADPNRPFIDARKHEFPFQFQIPTTGLATSFDANGAVGCIRYYIQVLVQRLENVIIRRKLLFPLVCPADLNTNTRSMERAEKSDEVKVGKTDGTVSASLQLHKRGLVPGEPIGATINLSNKTNAYADTPEMRYRETVFETSGVGLPEGITKIATGGSLSYRPAFNIPALVPNFDLVGCISVDYVVNLYVGLVRGKRSGILIHLQIPILIGTVPASEHSILEHLMKNPSAPPEYAIDLPNYEEFAAADKNNAYIRLPTYAESVAGRSEIAEKEDNGDGNSATYRPLYFQYQFDNEDNGNAAVDDTQKLL